MTGLRNKRVLVTGGAGFVGSHIVDSLIGEGCRSIVVIDNMVRGCSDNLARAGDHVDFLEGDIRDRGLMEDLVRCADIVFHQAALRITQCAAEPREAMEVMVGATFDLLELCVRHRVEKVVAASSASIYGMAEEFPTVENHHPYNNRTLYGAAKAFNESLLRSFHEMYGLPYVGLRYFNVYGPRMDIHGKYTEVLIRWMGRIEAGNPPIILGNGHQTMDFVNVRDVARANILAAKADVNDVVFNVGSGTETSLTDLAEMLLRIMDRERLTPQFEEERKVNPVPRRLAGTEAARRLLGFESSVSLEKGLAELVEWWRTQSASSPSNEVACLS